MKAVELLPPLQDLFSRHPEMADLAPWHLQWCLFALGYTSRLERTRRRSRQLLAWRVPTGPGRQHERARKGSQLMGQCAAYKPDGERCQRSAEGQHGLCWAHDPANAGRRKQVAAKGGRARANRERQWIKDELLRIAHKVETDESFDPTRANSAIRALAAASEISRSLEENDIASEFENLKSVLREHGVYIG